MRKALLTSLLLLLPVVARAQVTGPAYTFVAGTVASPDEVNSNFTTIYQNALNRTGGTMTGTLTAQQITPAATNTYDLGTAAAMFRSGYLRTSLVLGQTGGNYTVTWANPGAARALTIPDPGGTDTFVFADATQTLSNKTFSCTGCVTWTNLNKTGSSLADLATRAVANLSDGSNVALLNANNVFTTGQTIGTGPYATSGEVRGGASFAIRGRNVADSANIKLLALAADALSIGANATSVTFDVLAIANSAFRGTGGISTDTTEPGASNLRVAGMSTLVGAITASSTLSGLTGLTVGSTIFKAHAAGGVSVGDATDPGSTNLRVAETTDLTGQTRVNGGLKLNGPGGYIALLQSDSQSITCDASTENTLSVTGIAILRLTTSGGSGCLVKGLNGSGTSGQLITVINATGQQITLEHEDVSETGSNRMLLAGAGNLNFFNHEVAIFWYDGTNLRWRMLAR